MSGHLLNQRNFFLTPATYKGLNPCFPNAAKRLVAALEVSSLGGEYTALQVARNDRTLCARGAAVRKTLDTLIATR